MTKKNMYLAAVMMPAVILFCYVGWLSFAVHSGQTVRLRIKGFDPVDLLSGHYIRYQIDWDNSDCEQFSGGVCPVRDFEKMFRDNYWGRYGRFYVSEQDAEALDKAVQDSKNVAEIVYSYRQGMRPYALRLLINGEMFQNTGQ